MKSAKFQNNQHFAQTKMEALMTKKNIIQVIYVTTRNMTLTRELTKILKIKTACLKKIFKMLQIRISLMNNRNSNFNKIKIIN
jgi:hypothetical protein